MEIPFWLQRWQDNQTGFHLPEVNPYLLKFWPGLGIEEHSIVFIPLCGKSLDITWFAANQYSVLGVECSEKAIQAFFAEQNLPVQQGEFKAFRVHNSANINLLEGDFFKLDKEILADVAAVYDRASLIALPEEMRASYVSLLVEQLPASISILLVTLDYNQALMSGPPFSVSDTEVHELYKPHFNVELLQQQEILENQPGFRDRGLTSLIERVYKISR